VRATAAFVDSVGSVLVMSYRRHGARGCDATRAITAGESAVEGRYRGGAEATEAMA
jgi:hypothetical protein